MLTKTLKRLLPVQVLLILFVQGMSFLQPATTFAAASYNNATIANLALTHVGETYGDCWTFVRDMIYQASSHKQDISAAAGGGDYFAHLANAGGTQITSLAKLAKGDVVQEGHYGGHTYIINSSESGGTFDVVDANHDWAGTVMHYRRTVVLDSDDHAYRFGTVGSTSTGPAAWGGVGSSKYLGTDHLDNGQVMSAGQYIESSNGVYALTMQTNGDLALYGNGGAIWDSNTDGTDANRVIMQGDGNLVIYNAAGKALWSSKTAGNGWSLPVLQTDGNFIMHRASDYATTWSTNTGGHYTYSYFGSASLQSGQQLTTDQYLRSPDNRYALLMQENGNLVLYGPGYHVLWSSKTSGSGANRAIMQGDGNLVLYTSAGKAVWASNTNGKGNSYASLQSDGNFVLRLATDHTPTWATGTNNKT